jgi:hypothetical protein
MKIKAVGFVFLWFLFSAQRAEANEVLLQALQEQIASLQKTIGNLQSTVENQNRLIQIQGEKIQFLETRIEKGAASTATIQPGGTLPPASQLPALVSWNPEVGVIGDVVTHLTEDTADEEGNDSIVMRELELVFGQYVDPYSRFDAAVTLNDALDEQNAEIEQAYLTRYSLPFNFKAQIGKIRPKIGKANLLDRHALENVTEPLVLSNFFAEEGWKTSGVRLQNLIPNPWDIPLEITGEVLNGKGANSFGGVRRRPIFNAHLKSFFELSDTKSFEFGGTALFGTDNLDGTPRGNDRYSVHIFGFDATFIDLMDGIRRLKLQSELYFQDRNFRNPVSIDTDGDGIVDTSNSLDDHPWGFYALLDYKISSRWSAGIRFDLVKPLDSVILADGMPVAADIFGTEHAYEISPYLTLHQSEFALFRLQYSYTENAQGISDNSVYLQARFQIGVDRHGLQ